MKSSPVFTFLILLLSAGVAASGDDKPPVVEVAAVTERQIIDYEICTGRAEPVESVEIRARVTGYLTKVHFKEGADVKAGELLYEIDPRPYQADLAKAEADVALAQARLKLAAKELERTKALLPKGAVSR